LATSKAAPDQLPACTLFDHRTLLFLCTKEGKDDYTRDMVVGQPTLLDLVVR